jgi:hypothetical protein
MRSGRAVAGIIALAVLLSGCAGTTTLSAPTPTPTATPTPTPTPSAAALIISLDGLSVADAAGNTLDSALFAAGLETIAFVTKYEGSDPTIDDSMSPKGIRQFTWPDVDCSTRGSNDSAPALCSVHVSELAGLPVRTKDGIHVGSARADVVALDPFDDGYDGDGDGKSDRLGIEQQTMTDRQSLSFPGQPGTAYVAVVFTGDTVTRILAPSGDFYDI